MSNEHVSTVPALSQLTDDELTTAVRRLATDERAATAQLVAHLAEFDARRLYLGAGFPSLFQYCWDELRLSEHAAYNRIQAARAARLFPTIVDRLEAGSLTLTSVRLLAPHLTSENHGRVLDEAAGCRREAVEQIVARLSPKPDVAASVRRLPARVSAPVSGDGGDAPGGPVSSPTPTSSPVTIVALRSRQPVVVLAPGRYEIRFTASAETREKLRTAQELLRHAVPDGDAAEVIDRALTVLLDQLLKKKAAATARPRSTTVPGAAARTLPAAVRRAVWLRDGARCAFVAASGRRCGTRSFLEFHHLRPYALGGAGTVENIALRCRAHNDHEREQAFGRRPATSRERNATGSRSTRFETS